MSPSLILGYYLGTTAEQDFHLERTINKINTKPVEQDSKLHVTSTTIENVVNL
jgi:hypothetical protein